MKNLIASLILFTFMATASADILLIEHIHEHSNDVRPSRGMTMQQVEEQFGEAVIKYEAVGQPPITRWEYQDFSVYFEGRFVIGNASHRAEETSPPE